jgi:DHA2 family methylenomycin A resistance protein-like MFS transporter
MTPQSTPKRVRSPEITAQIRMSLIAGVVWSGVALGLAFAGLGITAFWLTIIVAGIIDTVLLDRVGHQKHRPLRQPSRRSEGTDTAFVVALASARPDTQAGQYNRQTYGLQQVWRSLGRLRLPLDDLFASTRRWWALTADCVMAFLVTLNTSPFIFLALPVIGRHFDASLATLQWVATGYLLGFGATHMLAVPITNAFGGRRAFHAGASLIVISSLLAATTGSLSLLICFRVAQGMGAALATQAGRAVVGHAFAPDGERPRALGRAYVAGYVSRLLGPLVAGFLIYYLGWRSIFFVTVAIGVFAIIVAGIAVPRPLSWSLRSISTYILPLCAFLIVSGVSLGVCVFVLEGWSTDATHVAIVATAVLPSCVVGWLYGVRGRRARAYRFMFSRAFIGGNLAAFTASFLSGPALLYGAIFLMTVRGYTALQVGVALCVVAAGSSVGFATIRRRLIDIRPRFQLLVALGILAGGLLLLSMTMTSSSYVAFLVPLAVIGLGGGLGVMPAFFAVRVAAPHNKEDIASSVIVMSGLLGASVGIATLTAYLAFGDYHVAGQVATLSQYSFGLGFRDALQSGFRLGAALAVPVTLVAYVLIKGYDKRTLTRENRGEKEMVSALAESQYT